MDSLGIVGADLPDSHSGVGARLASIKYSCKACSYPGAEFQDVELHQWDIVVKAYCPRCKRPFDLSFTRVVTTFKEAGTI